MPASSTIIFCFPSARSLFLALSSTLIVCTYTIFEVVKAVDEPTPLDLGHGRAVRGAARPLFEMAEPKPWLNFHPSLNTVSPLESWRWGYRSGRDCCDRLRIGSFELRQYGRLTHRTAGAIQHKHHVSGLGIDCRFCHTSVEKSFFCGNPVQRHLHDLSFTDLARQSGTGRGASQL